jgi:photosynthetic reaction center cytochrome c subunit
VAPEFFSICYTAKLIWENGSMKSKNRNGMAAGLGLIIAISFAGGQTSPTKPATSKTRLTDEAYKNIQVLKGVPADQLIPAMQFITYSLGVECSFCHVEGAPEKDDKKPKQTARKMMQMMFAVNQEDFERKREVTCYSCHHGSSHPVSTPMIAEAGAQVAPGQVQEQEEDEHGPIPPDVPPAEQIFAKYLDALGGAPAIGKLSTRAEKGTINLGGRVFPVDIFSKVPDKRMSIIHLPNGDNTTAYDGNSGWTSAPNRPVHDLTAGEMASSRAEVDLQLPLHIKQLFSELRPGKPEKIGDHDVYVVSGINTGEPPVKFYFDEHSGLLLRVLRYVDSPLGRNPTQTDYADYRDQGGVKIPFQRIIARPGSRVTIQIEEAHDNVAVDDSKFARPADSPSPKTPSP